MKQEKPNVVSESFISAVQEAPSGLISGLRILKNKLFIPEQELEEILNFYQNWLAKAGVGSYSREKLLNRVFGTESLALYYLPEGNECFIGYISNLPDSSPVELLKIKASNSVPIGSQDYIHPKDPSIKSLKSIEFKRPLNQSLQIWFEFGNDKCFCSESVVRRFAKVARQSRKTLEKYPLVNRSLKDVLMPFLEMLKNSKNISKSRFVFVPEVIKGDLSLDLKISYNLVFVIKGNEIIDFYETRGRAFDELIEKEIDYLVNKKGIKSIDVVQFVLKDPMVFAKLKIAGKWYGLEKKGFRFMLESISASKWFKGKIDYRYTLANVVSAITPALKNADWIDVSILGRHASNSDKSKSKFELKYIPWTFKTGKNYTITEFVEGGLVDRAKFR